MNFRRTVSHLAVFWLRTKISGAMVPHSAAASVHCFHAFYAGARSRAGAAVLRMHRGRWFACVWPDYLLSSVERSTTHKLPGFRARPLL